MTDKIPDRLQTPDQNIGIDIQFEQFSDIFLSQRRVAWQKDYHNQAKLGLDLEKMAQQLAGRLPDRLTDDEQVTLSFALVKYASSFLPEEEQLRINSIYSENKNLPVIQQIENVIGQYHQTAIAFFTSSGKLYDKQEYTVKHPNLSGKLANRLIILEGERMQLDQRRSDPESGNPHNIIEINQDKETTSLWLSKIGTHPKKKAV